MIARVNLMLTASFADYLVVALSATCSSLLLPALVIRSVCVRNMDAHARVIVIIMHGRWDEEEEEEEEEGRRMMWQQRTTRRKKKKGRAEAKGEKESVPRCSPVTGEKKRRRERKRKIGKRTAFFPPASPTYQSALRLQNPNSRPMHAAFPARDLALFLVVACLRCQNEAFGAAAISTTQTRFLCRLFLPKNAEGDGHFSSSVYT